MKVKRMTIKQNGKVSGITKNKNTQINKLVDEIKQNQKYIKHQALQKPLSRNRSKKQIKSYISSLGLDTVSQVYIEGKPTQIDAARLPILPPDEIILPQNTKSQTNKTQNTKTQNTKSDKKKKSGNTIPETQDYIIVIPSYNRVELIQSKTLKLLNHHGIDPARIKIFVANQEQYELYKSKILIDLYGEIIVGVIGLKNQRNFIMDYYPEGQMIVQMDDDLEKIMELVDPATMARKSTRRMGEIADLDGFIKRAFRMCRDRGIYLWGVYPLANARFMSPKTTTDLRFIVGPMWGMINRHRAELKATIDEKENAERTLQYYTLDGAVLRFNNIGIETRYYTNKGGMQNEGKNRKTEALKSVYYLHGKYPDLTKIYLGKKSGVPEIRMISNPK